MLALAAEVATLKTMLASVQGSLITSVGMLQEQVEYKMYHTLREKKSTNIVYIYPFDKMTIY